MRMVVLISLMGLVTFIPRAIPAFCLDRFHLSKRFEMFLKLIPYTAFPATKGSNPRKTASAFVVKNCPSCALFFAIKQPPVRKGFGDVCGEDFRRLRQIRNGARDAQNTVVAARAQTHSFRR